MTMASAFVAEKPPPRATGTSRRLVELLRQACSPPVRERRFWVVQALVVVLAGLHLLADLRWRSATGPFPGGIPVALLIIPVGYAAFRYGLTGSAATAAWATLLWLPDLLLPVDQGHAPSDIVNLVLVDTVALFFGQRIEAERLAHARVEKATLGRLSAEAGYRQLFEANQAPILVLDDEGFVREANPAARAIFGEVALGALAPVLIGADGPLEALAGRVMPLRDGRHYRLGLVALPEGGRAAFQIVFEDITKELSESRRVARQRALTLAAEEEQRRQLARELHDEPLQLLLHLARELELLGQSAGVTPEVVASLETARGRSLEAATRLRNLARDLRPPALDQLGLVPALSGFLAEMEDDTGLLVDLEVSGEKTRFPPEVELGAFRIVQEAVRNVVRHATASAVRVRLEFADSRLALSVADDGVGFEPDAVDGSKGHLGLIGMSERASLLGGSFEVDAKPGSGATVRVCLPSDGGSSAR